MPNSLGLSAYRTLARRNTPTKYKPKTERPVGEILWLHIPDQGDKLAVFDLARRFIQQRHGLNILITCSENINPPCQNVIVDRIPSEHPQDITVFLEHWKPNVCLWLWGDIRPNLILAASKAGIPLHMADADQQGFENKRDRWLPEVARDTMACFNNVLTRSEPAHARIAKLMRNEDRLELCGPLVAGGQPLNFVQSDFDDLSTALSGRPAWLAAAILPQEVSTVLAAHRHALRLSHRLMLILNPASEEQAQECENALSAEGLRSARWEDAVLPDDNCQVLLVTAQDELGLWYRIAPLSFLGSSLTAGRQGLDPLQAAALGTAILYGPNVRNHMASYTRLAAAGAARIVNDSGALGVAVARLISPDHAASMAMSGWDVVTQGAAVSDRISELVILSLDATEEGSA